MARNHEKNYGQLNRWWLHNVRKEVEKERRPRLEHLKTAAEIRKWLPLIKEEMESCLTHSQVPCYTDGKVGEYRRRLLHLEREYKSFARKLRKLGPAAAPPASPVQPYQRRHSRASPLTSDAATGVDGVPKKYDEIRIPVLDLEGNQPALELQTDTVSVDSGGVNAEMADQPLTFDSILKETGKDTNTECKQLNPLGIDYSSSGEDD
ncbi:uncharacterized protein LOC134534816 isoform X2 [Bacillus rossius redtenbacheri]|uniref:uncharacterized protein LOC134534816 isoform X2 n=1 Tax=Bacillus rossius redtenbacheri TaxID=93214 RepID=UPI002FDD789C